MESHIQHSMESRLDDCIITMTPLRLHYYDYVIAITLLRLRYSVPFRKKVQFCSAISLGAGAHFEFHVIRVGSTDALVVNLVYFMPLTITAFISFHFISYHAFLRLHYYDYIILRLRYHDDAIT